MNKLMKKAFTLAEVLLVVGIIGMVSALTIPNLKNNIDEDTNIAKLKATYGQLEAAIAAVVADYGSKKDAEDSCASGTTLVCFNNLLTSKLDLKLNCQNSNMSRCYTSEHVKDVDNSDVPDANHGYDMCSYAFILSNGAAVCYRDDHQGKFDVDVNGPKKGPNRRGIDIFTLAFDNSTHEYICAEDFYCPHDNLITRRGNDSFEDEYDTTAWAMTYENMDYIRCMGSLKWHSKTTCD